MTGNTSSTSDGRDAHRDEPPAGIDLLARLRTFQRVREGRVVAGVCTGVGARLGIDPVVLRVGLAVLTITSGAGLVLYLAAWLLLPEEGTGRSLADRVVGRQSDRSTGFLITCIVVLGLLASAVMAPWNGGWTGPFLVTITIVGLVMLSRRGSTTSAAPGLFDPVDTAGSEGIAGIGDSAGTSAFLGAAGGSAGSHDDRTDGGADSGVDSGVDADRLGADGAGTTDADPSTAPPTQPAPAPLKPDVRPQSWTQHAATPVPASFWNQPDPLGLEIDEEVTEPEPAQNQPPEKPRGPRSLLFPVTVGVAAIALLSLALLVGTGTTIPVAAWVAVPLGVIGLGLLVGTWYGRPGGLIALGTVLALLLPPLAIMDAWLGPNWGESPAQLGDHQLRVSDLDGLRSSYEHGAGPFVLDLRELEGPDDYQRSVAVEQGMGELTVRVPADVDVVVDASVGLGSVDLPGAAEGDHGTAPENHGGASVQVDEARYDAEGPATGELRLDLDLGMGHVEVSRG